MYRIALVELHQETNSFSKVPTDLQNFESLALYYDDDVHKGGDKHRLQIDGFRKAIKKVGKGKVEMVPIIAAWSHSGGKIKRDVFDHFEKHILSRLKENNLDAIYFSVHGAMGVEGYHDPEGDLLEKIRMIVGDDMPIGVSCDLHANVTTKMVERSTFITAYRTNPHRDHNKVGYKTGKILIETLLGKVKPVMSFHKLPILKGGGMNIDFIKPMNKVFRKMKKMEKHPDVLSVSTFMVHIWIDAPEVGWSCIVVTNDNPSLANQVCGELCELNWKIKDHPHPEPHSVEIAIRKIKSSGWKSLFGLSIISDLSDLVAAGAPGENTHILKSLLQEKDEIQSYVPVCDKEVVSDLFTSEKGSTVTMRLGGKLDPVFNESITVEGQLLYKGKSKYGNTAVVKCNKLYIIITSLPSPAFKPSFFKKLGLSLWKADVIVVKNLFPFRLFYWKYNRQTLYVETKGVTDINVEKLNYQHIPRPIYPLDPVKNWR